MTGVQTCALPISRLDPERFALFERGVPKIPGVTRAEENFNAVFSSVTGSRDRNISSIETKIDNMVSRRKIDIFAEQRVKEFHDTRPLNCDSAKIRAAIR